ncbi:MAG: class I SAM-dependent methyltransferase [Bacteroidetes bacterium]|nr:class I SAM-dependent methyltransferase [Bacteroidota bacterium]
MNENEILVRDNLLLEDEINEYTRIYIEHGEWWLDYLRATDEKIATSNVLWKILSKKLTFRNEQFRILDIGAGEGSPTLMLLHKLNDKNSTGIDFIEPSPFLRRELKINLLKKRVPAINYRIIPKTFQDFEGENYYDVILAINSLCGYMEGDLYQLERILKMLKPKGICVLILQSRYGEYKKVQKLINEGKYLSPMLDAEELEEMLTIHTISYSFTSFKARLVIDLSKDCIVKNNGVLSLLLREDFSHMLKQDKKRSLDVLYNYIIAEKYNLEIQNKIFIIDSK